VKLPAARIITRSESFEQLVEAHGHVVQFRKAGNGRIQVQVVVRLGGDRA
jgi:hypothetical protein